MSDWVERMKRRDQKEVNKTLRQIEKGTPKLKRFLVPVRCT